MTERFMVDDAGTLIDMHTRDTFDYVSDVCGLLNELHEENQELKRLIKVTVEDYIDLEQSFDLIDKENEQLQTKNNAYIQDIEVFKEENTHLKLENEHLKQFIDDLTTKGTGRIDLANGYSYSVNAILTNWKSDVE